MSTADAPSIDTIARDFRTRMQGKLEDDQIDAAVASLQAATGRYPAVGSVGSAIFYIKWVLEVKGGKTFEGNSGGLSTPGGGALAGDVFTDDINRLYRDTRSFEFNSTGTYTSLLFFDGNTNLLGHFQGAAVSTVAGIGGGTGRWV